MANDNVNIESILMSNFLNLMLSNSATPADFHGQVAKVKDMLSEDVSGLVDSLSDFMVNSANVGCSIETGNDKFTATLKKWLDTINIGYNGQVPIGINALAKEYYSERWKYSSLPVLRIAKWEKIDGIMLPTKMFFLDGGSIYAKKKDDNNTIRLLDYDYFLGKPEAKAPNQLIKNVLFSKVNGRWFDKYPKPFLVKRGIYRNWKLIDTIKGQEERILKRIIPYLLQITKGGMFGDKVKTYSNKQLTGIMNEFKQIAKDIRQDEGMGIRVSNMDEEIKHLIPDLSDMFNPVLFANAERAILTGFGFVDIMEATANSIDREELVYVKQDKVIKHIKVKELDKLIQSQKVVGHSLEVPTYENGSAIWKSAKLWKHPYKGKMYKIITNNGKDFVRTTANHSIMIWENEQLISKRADELKKGDMCLTLGKFDDNKKNQALNYYDTLGSNQSKKVRNKRQVTVDEEFAYLMGWYMAEGCTTKYSINIGNTKPQHVDELKRIADKSLNKKTYIYTKEYEYDSRLTYHELRINSKGLSEVFNGIFNKYAKYKKIPTVIFNSPKSVQAKFLEGYLLGDGHFIKRDHTWNCTTASEEMSMNLMLLGKQLGYSPRLHIQVRKDIKYYIVRFCTYSERIPTKAIPKRKFAIEGYLKNHLQLKESYKNLPTDWEIKLIETIETYDYNDMVYDLEVEDNPTFVAGTKILVHNSRKESILNPKAFVEEVKSGVSDWKQLMNHLVLRIQDANMDAHYKYMNAQVKVITSPVQGFMTDEFKRLVRILFDRGRVSSQTAVELIAEVDFETEVMRRKKEDKDDIQKTLYPVVTQNFEDKALVSDKPNKTDELDDKNRVIPEDKTDKTLKKDYNNSGVKITMYSSAEELPDAIKNNMSKTLQSVWMKAFNKSYESKEDTNMASKSAWDIIKSKASKNEKTGRWIKDKKKS